MIHKILFTCVLLFNFVGCSSKKVNPPPGPHYLIEDALAKGGTASEIYQRLTGLQTNANYITWIDVARIRKAFKAAARSEPPAISKNTSTSEVVWAVLAADVIGDQWERRLPNVFRSSNPNALGQTCRVCDKLPSRFYWTMLEVSEGRTDLEDIWVAFVSKFLNELSPPPGELPKVLSELPNELRYLTPSGIQKMVEREALCFSDKWLIASSLQLVAEDLEWDASVQEMQSWLLAQARIQVEPKLIALETGNLDLQGFQKAIRDGYGIMENAILAEFVRTGPNETCSGGVMIWLEAVAKDSQKLRGGIQDIIMQRLPEWSKKYDKAKGIETLLKQQRPSAG